MQPETLAQKAQRLGIKPAGQPVASSSESLAQKAARLGIKPANAPVPKENNVIQSLFTNTIGRPAIRAAQAAVGLGINAFGNDEQKRNFESAASKPVDLPLGLGRVEGQKAFGQGGAKQIGIDTAKSALDIGSFAAGPAVNNAILKTVPKIVPKAVARVGANALGGVAYNTAYNAVNGRDLTDNIGTSAVLGAGIPLAVKAVSGVAKAIGGNTPGAAKGVLNPSSIMQRVARISPTKQSSFKQKAGEEVGEFLTNRGIYGNEEEITKKLYDRFNTSKTAVDDTLATIQGTHKYEPVKTALDELVGRETRISTPGAVSADFNKIQQLANKYEAGGLSMSEINEVKRLYERNVRLDYLKSNLTENVSKANNIDSAIRNWQVETANKAGFKNLKELNKETMLSRQLADDLWKTYSGKEGNNAISLTDWLLLSGDPTGASIPAFLLKKVVSSKSLQSKLAKTLAGEAKIGIPKAEVAPRLALQSGTQKRSTINVPINLPSRSQSTIDSLPTSRGSGMPLRQSQPEIKSVSYPESNNTIPNKASDFSPTLPKAPNSQGGFVDLKPRSKRVDPDVKFQMPKRDRQVASGLAALGAVGTAGYQVEKLAQPIGTDVNSAPSKDESPVQAASDLQKFVPDKYRPVIVEAVEGTRITPKQLAALVQSENGMWDESFVNPAGTDTGLGQHNEQTYEDINRIYKKKYGRDYDRTNGEENLRATALWLDHLLDRKGIDSIEDAVKAYRIGVEGLGRVRTGRGTKTFTQAQLRSMANDKLVSFEQFLE